MASKKCCGGCPKSETSPALDVIERNSRDRFVAHITATACTWADTRTRNELPSDYRWLCMTTIARARELDIDIENILDVVFPV